MTETPALPPIHVVLAEQDAGGIRVELIITLQHRAGPQVDAAAQVAPALPADGELNAALTRREQQVLDLVAQRQSNAAIGAALFISESTVKRHVHHIFQKLAVSNRYEAAAHAPRLKRAA